ncbi:MAG: tRNA dihydrouridine synthase DusB [Candidatus Gorgyraea atricola]|nr:tRNA dihydrouridine synthase DusB [Candidatus Gorgyraea atricola]
MPLLTDKVFLSPMAGISSLPFRMLNRGFGCGFCFLEMINCRSLSYSSRKTQEMMKTSKEDKPLGVQILGAKKEFILKALEKLQDYQMDILDFNAACPQKKITSRGEGAALLKTPKTLNKLLKLIVKNSDRPVTAKIRLGWNDFSHARDIALYAQDAGIHALFVHGRTKEQGYSGKVNYKAIRMIKKAVDIPIVGSGDILSAELAKRMLDETGCDAITVARGALGNPWIFKEIKEFLKTGKILKRPSIKDIAKTMKLHLDLGCDFYGERRGVVNFRKFFIWYTRYFKGTKPLRNKVTRINTMLETARLVDDFLLC